MEKNRNRGKHPPAGSRLYENLADEIMEYIHSENIRPGERIPSERSLAEYFDTSRTTVREAVRILENNNILDIQIGNGMYLKEDVSPEVYNIELWKIDYLELLDIRAILEEHIIGELCCFFPPESLHPVEEALRQLEAGYQRGIFDQASDILFHKRLRACSSNQTLIQLLDGIVFRLDSYGRKMDEGSRIRYWYDTVPWHRRMLEGILEHKTDKAGKAFRKIYELDRKALSGEL